jgi:type II secretory pathway predicted ATPase ExeA
MKITASFKTQVADALAEVRRNFGGSDSNFAKSYGLQPSAYSRIKNGDHERVISDTQWLNLGRALDIRQNALPWAAAETDVFKAIKSDVETCQAYHKAMILVDDCAIGKTFTARYLSKTLRNCFYIDASQCKTQQLFVRNFARVLGIDGSGRYADIKENIKYYLSMLENPVVIIDEAGDLNYRAFLELKEFWNATDGHCGWYMMGADGLRSKIESGIQYKKVGFRELFSRYSDRFMKIVPTEQQARKEFYKRMVTQVLSANMKDKTHLDKLVKKSLASDTGTDLAGLRRAQTILIFHQQANAESL